MTISSLRPKSMEKHLDTRLHPRCESDELARAREAGERVQDVRRIVGDLFDAPGDPSEPIELGVGTLAQALELSTQLMQVREQRRDVVRELVLHGRQHALRATTDARERDEQRDQSSGEGDDADRYDDEKPRLHEEGIIELYRTKVNKFIDLVSMKSIIRNGRAMFRMSLS